MNKLYILEKGGLRPIENPLSLMAEVSSPVDKNITEDKELYDKALNSGMFFEFYPELSGDWDKDRKKDPVDIASMSDFLKQKEAKNNAHANPQEKSAQGVKYSKSKAPMGKILKQFPLALEAIAYRSGYGHEKYKDTDLDWKNFKRVPDAVNEYEDAIVRHLACIGEPHETELDHLKAAAWNILAKLQLILEQQKQ